MSYYVQETTAMAFWRGWFCGVLASGVAVLVVLTSIAQRDAARDAARAHATKAVKETP